MAHSSSQPRPEKVDVFFTDGPRLAALAQIHQEILGDEPSGVSKLIKTRDTAHELMGIIDGHRADSDPSHPAPAVLRLELDEGQISTLSLARNFVRNNDPSQSQGPDALLS